MVHGQQRAPDGWRARPMVVVEYRSHPGTVLEGQRATNGRCAVFAGCTRLRLCHCGGRGHRNDHRTESEQRPVQHDLSQPGIPGRDHGRRTAQNPGFSLRELLGRGRESSQNADGHTRQTRLPQSDLRGELHHRHRGHGVEDVAERRHDRTSARLHGALQPGRSGHHQQAAIARGPGRSQERGERAQSRHAGEHRGEEAPAKFRHRYSSHADDAALQHDPERGSSRRLGDCR